MNDHDKIAKIVVERWMETSGFNLFSPLPRVVALLRLARICTEMAKRIEAEISDIEERA